MKYFALIGLFCFILFIGYIGIVLFATYPEDHCAEEARILSGKEANKFFAPTQKEALGIPKGASISGFFRKQLQCEKEVKSTFPWSLFNY